MALCARTRVQSTPDRTSRFIPFSPRRSTTRRRRTASFGSPRRASPGVMIKTGLLTTKSWELLLPKIEGIQVEQSLAGRLNDLAPSSSREPADRETSLRASLTHSNFDKRSTSRLNDAADLQLCAVWRMGLALATGDTRGLQCSLPRSAKRKNDAKSPHGDPVWRKTLGAESA